MRLLAVHQERKAVLPRQRRMCLEDPELSLERSALHAAPVEAALPDGHRDAAAQERVQPFQRWPVLRLRQLGQQLGMDAQADLDPRLARRKRQERLPRPGADGRNQDALQARRPRPGEHLRPVGVEPRHVAVAVGVDQGRASTGRHARPRTAVLSVLLDQHDAAVRRPADLP
jgi:hypothetical protein